MSIIPMAVYGLSVEPHGIPIPAEGSMEGAVSGFFYVMWRVF